MQTQNSTALAKVKLHSRPSGPSRSMRKSQRTMAITTLSGPMQNACVLRARSTARAHLQPQLTQVAQQMRTASPRVRQAAFPLTSRSLQVRRTFSSQMKTRRRTRVVRKGASPFASHSRQTSIPLPRLRLQYKAATTPPHHPLARHAAAIITSPTAKTRACSTQSLRKGSI